MEIVPDLVDCLVLRFRESATGIESIFQKDLLLIVCTEEKG